MEPAFGLIYKENENKSLTQLKRKKRYLEKRLKEGPVDPLRIDNGQATLYQVTLDIVNELIEKKRVVNE